MDNETKEMLQLILAGQQELKQGQERMEQRLDKLETKVMDIKSQVRELKHTANKTAYQVDILYDWVDGIDLKVKDNTNTLNNLPLAK